jgi:hypothetical protein
MEVGLLCGLLKDSGARFESVIACGRNLLAAVIAARTSWAAASMSSVFPDSSGRIETALANENKSCSIIH